MKAKKIFDNRKDVRAAIHKCYYRDYYVYNTDSDEEMSRGGSK